MTSALVQTCADPRLNHELLRIQLAQKLEKMRLEPATSIFVLNEIGGNLSANLRNTLNMLLKRHEAIVVAAVLHHDDCIAAREGLRQPLETSASALESLLKDREVRCPVLTGQIKTETNRITWSDDPVRTHISFRFHMPRIGLPS